MERNSGAARARVQTITDGGRDADCGEEVHGIAVVAGRDASEVLQAAEHALDGVAVAIEEWREAVLPLPICLWRDVWHRATLLDLLTDRISVVAIVGVQDVAVRRPFEPRLCTG